MLIAPHRRGFGESRTGQRQCGHLHLSERCGRLGQLPLGLYGERTGFSCVEQQERIAGAHPLPLLHRDTHDHSRDLAADRDPERCLDMSTGHERLHQVGAEHWGDRYSWAQQQGTRDPPYHCDEADGCRNEPAPTGTSGYAAGAHAGDAPGHRQRFRTWQAQRGRSGLGCAWNRCGRRGGTGRTYRIPGASSNEPA